MDVAKYAIRVQAPAVNECCVLLKSTNAATSVNRPAISVPRIYIINLVVWVKCNKLKAGNIARSIVNF